MSKRILLVDDSPMVRAMLRLQIESQPGLEVCGEACDGFDAFEKALELLPDLIVLDLSMPRMCGLEAARMVRDKLPHVVIILFTSHKNAIEKSIARQAGLSAIISKSDPELLMAEVRILLERIDHP